MTATDKRKFSLQYAAGQRAAEAALGMPATRCYRAENDDDGHDLDNAETGNDAEEIAIFGAGHSAVRMGDGRLSIRRATALTK